MKILVTGSSGYVASALIPELLLEGHAVRGIDLVKSDNPHYEFIKGDIRNPKLMVKLVKGMDAVIHLAAVVPTHPTLEPEMSDINFKGTCRLGQLSKESGVKKFIFASSCSVYASGSGLTETSELGVSQTSHAPDTSYAYGKMCAEKFLISLSTKGFSPIILRFATIFGIAPKISWQSLFNMFVRDALQKKELVVKYVDAYRPFCHVKDIVNGIILVLDKPENITNGQVYNVGGINATKLELTEMIKKIVPDLSIKNIGGSDIGYSVDFKKIESLGFKLSKDLDYGISELKEAINGTRVL